MDEAFLVDGYTVADFHAASLAAGYAIQGSQCVLDAAVRAADDPGQAKLLSNLANSLAYDLTLADWPPSVDALISRTRGDATNTFFEYRHAHAAAVDTASGVLRRLWLFHPNSQPDLGLGAVGLGQAFLEEKPFYGAVPAEWSEDQRTELRGWNKRKADPIVVMAEEILEVPVYSILPQLERERAEILVAAVDGGHSSDKTGEGEDVKRDQLLEAAADKTDKTDNKTDKDKKSVPASVDRVADFIRKKRAEDRKHGNPQKTLKALIIGAVGEANYEPMSKQLRRYKNSLPPFD